MATRDVVVIGGSAGALQPLRVLGMGLPTDFPASVFVVIHSSRIGGGHLISLLGRGNLPVEFARDGEAFEPGHIYLPAADHHLLLEGQRLRLSHGPSENGFRPAIDPLFRSAARYFGPRVIGVILSGKLDDGTYGAMMIHKRGGLMIAQAPKDASACEMPESVIRHTRVEHVVPASELAPLLNRLVNEEVSEPTVEVGGIEPQEGKKPFPLAILQPQAVTGPPSALTCPACGGALWAVREGKLERFYCHLGHAYSEESVLLDQRDKVEHALWNALRVLAENAALHRRMATRARENQLPRVAESRDRQAEEAEAQALSLQDLLFR